MRVTPSGGLEPAGPQRPKDAPSTGTFARMIDGARSRTVAAGPAAVPLSPLQGLLALPSEPDVVMERRRQVSRARTVLDRLEELRLALLKGELGLPTLVDLRRGLGDQAGVAHDPALSGLLAEIELRVEVELAKLEQQVGADA